MQVAIGQKNLHRKAIVSTRITMAFLFSINRPATENKIVKINLSR